MPSPLKATDGRLKDPGKRNAKLSAGFFGILLSLHVCGHVDVFGFNQGARHYYKKTNSKFMKGHAFAGRHKWVWERECMKALPAMYDGVKVWT